MTVFLETKRLILKKTEQSDFSNLFALRSDPDVMKYTEQGVQTKKDVQDFLEITVPYQVTILSRDVKKLAVVCV